MPDKITLHERLSINLDNLTRNITYLVIICFLIILATLLGKSLITFTGDENDLAGQEWLSLFRDGFLLLSGILTTLIGYYFGNKGSSIATKQIDDLSKENEKLQSDLAALSPTNEDQDSGIDPIMING